MTEPTERMEWEEEFEAVFNGQFMSLRARAWMRQKHALKSFIRALIEKTRTDERQRVLALKRGVPVRSLKGV